MATLYINGLLAKHTHLILIHFPLNFFIGPLFYLYIRTYLSNHYKITPVLRMTSIFAAVAAASLIPFYTSDPQFKVEFVYSPKFFYEFNFLQLINFIYNSIFLFMGLISLKKFKLHLIQKLSSIDSLKLNWLRLFSITFILIGSIIFIGYISGLKFNYPYFLPLFLTIQTYAISYYSLKKTPVFDYAQTPIKYENLNLPETVLEELKKSILKIMEKEKCYLNPDFKLLDLAGKMGVKEYILSYVLNHCFKKNFFEFINNYRIEEAKKRLRNSKNEYSKILTIAMEVGYNSKSSFNTAFKKMTGKTPSEYRVGTHEKV